MNRSNSNILFQEKYSCIPATYSERMEREATAATTQTQNMGSELLLVSEIQDIICYQIHCKAQLLCKYFIFHKMKHAVKKHKMWEHILLQLSMQNGVQLEQLIFRSYKKEVS